MRKLFFLIKYGNLRRPGCRRVRHCLSSVLLVKREKNRDASATRLFPTETIVA